MQKIIVFDAYGTLFDVNAAARNYSEKTNDATFIKNWEKVSSLWRDKQIAYTWYYNSIGYKTNFWKVTEDSLDYALDFYKLNQIYNLRSNLLKLYNELDLFPEVLEVFKFLKLKGYPIAILSNGTLEMLTNATSSSKISSYLDMILSAEDLGLFKPNKKVYSKVLDYFSCEKKDVIFVSSNGWDASGGSAFGFSCLWVNRNHLPEERMLWKPRWTGNDLNYVLTLI